MAKITEGECSASECSLICNDYWSAGYGRIMMVPRVKLAYDRVCQVCIFTCWTALSCPLSESIRYHSSHAPKFDRYTRLRPHWWAPRRPTDRSPGPIVVRSTRSSVRRGRVRTHRLCPRARERYVTFFSTSHHERSLVDSLVLGLGRRR